jgi:hypothetical protein
MLAFRSVVSVLVRALGDFSLHPQGRPCGRPPAAAVLAPAATRREPGNRPHPPLRRVRSHAPADEGCSLAALEGQIPILPGLMQVPIPTGSVPVIEPVLVSPPTTTRTPNPREHSLDLVQHVADLSALSLTFLLIQHQNRAAVPAHGVSDVGGSRPGPRWVRTASGTAGARRARAVTAGMPQSQVTGLRVHDLVVRSSATAGSGPAPPPIC